MKIWQRTGARKTQKIAAALMGLLVFGIIMHAILSAPVPNRHGGFEYGNGQTISKPGHKGRGGHKPWPIIAADWALSIGKMLAA